MKKITIIIILSCAGMNCYAQKDSVTWAKSFGFESRPYAPLSGNTLSKNFSANFSASAQFRKSNIFIMKGIDLIDEKSSANYIFVEASQKRSYKKLGFRYSLLASINHPALVFDPKGSMSGASLTVGVGTFPKLSLTAYYLTPWYYKPNYIVRPKIAWVHKSGEFFAITAWYNSGMFSKKTGLSAGVEYSSKNISIGSGMFANVSVVYNYDIAGNMLHIENQSSKDVFSIRAYLNF